MTRERNAPALLGAKEHSTFQDLSGDVFESHCGLGAFEPMIRTDLFDHRGCGQRFDHPALLGTMSDEVL